MPFHPLLEEWDTGLVAGDPLDFPGYAERAKEVTDGEAVRTGRTQWYAFVEGRFDVHGGTMGAAVGEKVVRAYDRARELSLPMVVVTCTGGARVQEGMVALIQLPRTVAAARRHASAGLLSLGIYGSPTTGGVFASYASMVDLRAAHPRATIGFAGPRVAEEALGTSLPPGSHTARSLYQHGLLDALIEPGEEAAWVELALGLRDRPLPTRPLPAVEDPGVDGAWGEVLRARAPGRPSGIDWAARLCRSWLELRGDDPSVRAGLATLAPVAAVGPAGAGPAAGAPSSAALTGGGPAVGAPATAALAGRAPGAPADAAVVGAGREVSAAAVAGGDEPPMARASGDEAADRAGGDQPTTDRVGEKDGAGRSRRCVVVATDRHHGTGRPTPAGYRLAQRAVSLAGRLGLPLVTLVDTPGADPSPQAEVDGLGLEMAQTLAAFAACPTPIVSVCVGEGGSGGALALSFADRLLMGEHAVFSVIGPEGAAEILERDAGQAPEVAERLKLTARDLVGLGIVDGVIGETQDDLGAAVLSALDDAVVGDRERRFDRATARWL